MFANKLTFANICDKIRTDKIKGDVQMSEPLKTQKSIVAFVDLLGTSQAIKNDEHDINLNSMNYILQTAFDMCADPHICKAKVNVKAFSDNIVFSMELPEDGSEIECKARVHNIIEICAYFQIAAFGMGITTRGGITVGDFFCNDIFVWGKALLRAYNLESKVAIYPRIVIDENVLPLMSERDNTGNRHHAATDFDGIVFLDYLSFFTMQTRDEYIKRSLKDTELIIKTLGKDERAIQKVRWTASYLERGLSDEAKRNG